MTKILLQSDVDHGSSGEPETKPWKLTQTAYDKNPMPTKAGDGVGYSSIGWDMLEAEGKNRVGQKVVFSRMGLGCTTILAIEPTGYNASDRQTASFDFAGGII